MCKYIKHIGHAPKQNCGQNYDEVHCCGSIFHEFDCSLPLCRISGCKFWMHLFFLFLFEVCILEDMASNIISLICCEFIVAVFYVSVHVL